VSLDFMEKDKHFIADIPQKALLEYGGRVLLVKETKQAGRWQLPGGRLNEGETPKEGLKREIREELSMEIDVEGIFDTFVYKSVSGLNHYLVIYRCHFMGNPEDIKLDKENQEMKWVRKGEYEDLDPMWDEYRAVLDRFFNQSVPIKEID